MANVPFILNRSSGLLSLVLKGKKFDLGKDHHNYQRILDSLEHGTEDELYLLADVVASVVKFSHGHVKVLDNGMVTYKDKPIHNVVARRILDFIIHGIPFQHMLAFLNNLFENPSEHSIEQLYSFLENGGFPITPDGYFLGYKAIRGNYTDKHTGKFDNSPGKVVEVPRDQVDPNHFADCSYGLHVGTYEYAKGFGSHGDVLVLVKVNPRDCVSVPAGEGHAKLRCCRYEVVAVYERQGRMDLPAVGPSGEEDWDWGADENDEENWDEYEEQSAYFDAEGVDYPEDEKDEEWEKAQNKWSKKTRDQLVDVCVKKKLFRTKEDARRARKEGMVEALVRHELGQ